MNIPEYFGCMVFDDREMKSRLPVEAYEHDMKLWWPHNEALIASLMIYRDTKDEKYLDIFGQILDYSKKYFASAPCGEWYGYLHYDNTVSTTLKVSKTKISSGTKLVITLKDKNGLAVKGKKIYLNVPSKKRVFTGTTDAKGQVKFSFFNIGSFKSYASFKGDSSFKASKTDFTFKVIKSKTKLTISDTTCLSLNLSSYLL